MRDHGARHQRPFRRLRRRSGVRRPIARRDPVRLLEGGLVACDVVWAEVAAAFPTASEVGAAMNRLGVRFVPLDAQVSAGAGGAWRSYRRSGGSRSRILADFLIGAHAAATADRLLTRDRGFYRKHFDRLTVIDPTP
jgi:predicted nucleic acid-binding protein